MSKEYSLQGTKIIMRRLFKYDIAEITECFKSYDQLFFNPLTVDFISNVFLYGEFWGAFSNGKLIACSYLYPFESQFFKKEKRYSQLCDFLPDPGEYLYMGYVGIHCKNKLPAEKAHILNNIYQAFLNVAEMQAFRRNLKKIIHCVPLKIPCDISPVFSNGFELVKLRGLEKLVVHYIFVKSIYPNNDSAATKTKGESLDVALSNTKTLSGFLENGYCAREISKDSNEIILSLFPLVTD